nr:hypothetical protein [uncultured Flavobacterium sp.]
MFRFISGNDLEGYTYEITFNKSLEHTVRMQAMIDGLNRYDKRRKFWYAIHNLIAVPLSTLPFKWAIKFRIYASNRY